MKVLSKSQLEHRLLESRTTGESYSLSSVVSDLLGSRQTFIHHDILPPGKRSSGNHYHTTVEEIVYVLKGEVTLVQGIEGQKSLLQEGSFAIFFPDEKETHALFNHTGEPVETITFSVASKEDRAVFPSTDVT